MDARNESGHDGVGEGRGWRDCAPAPPYANDPRDRRTSPGPWCGARHGPCARESSHGERGHTQVGAGGGRMSGGDPSLIPLDPGKARKQLLRASRARPGHPRVHSPLPRIDRKTWMAGTSPGMTELGRGVVGETVRRPHRTRMTLGIAAQAPDLGAVHGTGLARESRPMGSEGTRRSGPAEAG